MAHGPVEMIVAEGRDKERGGCGIRDCDDGDDDDGG